MTKKTRNPERTTPIDRLIPMPEVRALTSLSKATIYRKVAERTFPAPIRISKSRVAWRQASIAEWMAAQPPTNSAA